MGNLGRLHGPWMGVAPQVPTAPVAAALPGRGRWQLCEEVVVSREWVPLAGNVRACRSKARSPEKARSPTNPARSNCCD